MSLTKFWIVGSLVVGLAGCSNLAGTKSTTDRPDAEVGGSAAGTTLTPEQASAAAAITQAPSPKPAARATAAQLDTTTKEQKAAASAKGDTAEALLGTTVASLGDPTEGGFWIKTPLVKSRAVGRIENPANGKSSKVDLIPLDGPASGGSQVSLPALQLIGVSLTDLPELKVFKS